MSSPIDIPGGLNLPDIGYYDTNNDGPSTNPDSSGTFTSYTTLNTNLNNVCTTSTDGSTSLVSSPGLYTGDNTAINNLDIPFYLAKTGKLLSSPGGDLNNTVIKACTNNPQSVTNQIQYLLCQLQACRNRKYDSSNLSAADPINIFTILSTYPSLTIPVRIMFIISIFFGIYGFFGSLDVAGNIFSEIEKTKQDLYYWVGLLIGLALPFILMTYLLKNIICTNLNELEEYNITNNAYGVKNTADISSSSKKIDIATLILFIFLIYAFVAVLFTIKRSNFSNMIYTTLTGIILIIIAIFIYVFYAFIPFFNTADSKNIMKATPRSLNLFITTQTDISQITTNQTQDREVRMMFLKMFVVIFVLGCVFFVMKDSHSLISGFLTSFAILMLPFLLVLNYILVVQYFIAYPIVLLIMRFLRYIMMTVLYMMYSKGKGSGFSDDLVDKLNNFKNYSAPWGLIGVDEFKLFLNVLGHNNIFSKEIIGENNSKNISDNKFVSSGLLAFFVPSRTDSNKSSMILSGATILLTIIISGVVLSLAGKS